MYMAMSHRLITLSAFFVTIAGFAADKPSPFPSQRAKENPVKPVVQPSAVSPMAGGATFFRFKEDAPPAEKLTAAHVSLPVGSRVKVLNQSNGKSVLVRITDHFAGGNGMVISVSQPAAEQLGFVRDGTAQVKLELVSDSAAR